MNDATPTDRLYRIAREGLCIGCGLCEAVAGPDNVKVVKTLTGYERPVVVGTLDHATVDRIYDVCPGTRIDGMPEREIDSSTRMDDVWGPWHRMVRAHAADPEIRFEGSTGGVLTALGSYLLSSGRVSFVYHARASGEEPTFGEAHLSFSHADVVAGAGSRYGPTAILARLDEALAYDEPFAFIGKPCDIAALRNQARHDGRIDRLVRYWLALVCGGFAPPESTKDFLERVEIEPAAITAFRYRGRGCPGPIRIETGDRVTEAHYIDLWGVEESKWTLPWRCKICPDGIGDSADLAASDTWIGGSPNRIDSETDPGTNAVVARTARGAELLESAARDGAITIEYDIMPDEMSVYQPHQMHKKYQAGPRLQGLADAGYMVPSTRGLRLAELASQLPDATTAAEREGTSHRVREGRAAEPDPSPARGMLEAVSRR